MIQTKRAKLPRGLAKENSPDFESSESKELFEKLKETRLSLAKSQRVPPYVIFHDATLRELAHSRPKSLAQMEGVSGIGKSKLKKYGTTFLKIISN